MTISVWLADDHVVMRQALRMLLDAESDIEVIGESGDGISTINLVQEAKPDVAVIDITMPQLNGIEVTREIVNRVPHVAVVILSMHGEDRFVIPAFRAGALGYVLKQSANDELLMAIRAAKRDEAFLSPPVAPMIINGCLNSDYPSSPVPMRYGRLTRRERQVFQLVAEGKSLQDIATLLCINYATVGTHKGNLMTKLHLSTTAELVRYALRHGFVSLDAG